MFLDDLFGADGVTTAVSGEGTTLTRENLATDLPGEPYQQWEAQEGGGSFEITSGVDDLIYINEGGGAVSTQVAAGWYTLATLKTAVDAALNANLSLAYSYALDYNSGARKFNLTAIGGTIAIPNSSSPARNMLTILLGWDETDLSGSTSYSAQTERSSTVTWAQFTMPSGAAAIAPNLIALMLDSTGGTETSTTVMYGDVTVYGSASYPGNSEAAWAAAAGLTLTVSARPTYSENTLQGAVTSNATGYRYWAVYWTHVDDHEYHQIRICRAMTQVMSATRTCREVGNHDLYVRTRPRTLENQHPVALKSDWRMTIELERWEASEYRAFVVAAKRYGFASGMVFSLLWTDLIATPADFDDHADKGLIFYGTIQSAPPDAYGAKGSDFMTGALSFGQLIP